MKIRLVINTKRPWKSTEEFKYERYSMVVVSHSSFLFMSSPFRNCTATTWRHLFLHSPEPTVLSIILPILAPVSRESWVREGHDSLCSLKWLWREMSFLWCFLLAEACSLHVWMSEVATGTMYDHTLTHLLRGFFPVTTSSFLGIQWS